MRAYKGLQKDFVAGEKVEKIFWFSDLSILKRQWLYSSWRDAKLKLGMWKGYLPFVNGRYTKGVYTFFAKNGVWNGKSLYPLAMNAVK